MLHPKNERKSSVNVSAMVGTDVEEAGDLHEISASAATREAAIDACVQSFRSWLEKEYEESETLISISDSLSLPADVAEFAPDWLPKSCGLMVLECFECHCGNPMSYRFFAVPLGNYEVPAAAFIGVHRGSREVPRYTIGEEPTYHSFSDDVCEREWPLPAGSYEWVKQNGLKKWAPCSSAQYNYYLKRGENHDTSTIWLYM